MEKFDINLIKYNKCKLYIVKPFDWGSVSEHEIIKMDIKGYKFGSDFLYFHVVDKTTDDILCTPKDKPSNFYSFHSSYFNDGDSTLKRITENGDVEFKLEVMTQVSLFKWLYFKLNNLLTKIKQK
tara:strand:- start:1448 stop:1822 length:375 start_codon:yes stop_codon:yes gene_type:complete